MLNLFGHMQNVRHALVSLKQVLFGIMEVTECICS